MEIRQLQGHTQKNGILREVNFLEICKLQQNRDFIFKKNQEKYMRIQKTQANYHIDLYEPNEKLRTQKAFKKQLLLKQIDKLMDQQAIFDKKLAQINFSKEEEKQNIQNFLDKQLHPYKALKTVWAKHQLSNFECKNSIQRIESLNFTVGAIKSTIMGMKIRQQKSAQIRQPVICDKNSQKYDVLQSKYEQSLMMNQQLRQIICSLQSKLLKKAKDQRQLNEKILEKQKQIKLQKKLTQAMDIDKKFVVAHLKQQIHTFQRKLQTIEKWKNKLENNLFQNKTDNFKFYLQVDSRQNPKKSQICCYTLITKKLPQILKFLSEYQDIQNKSYQMNNPEYQPMITDQNDQSPELIIPSLNLNQNNEQVCIREKISTDRPLKTRNLQSDRFLVGKTQNNKFGKVSPLINQDSMIKFIRKSSNLGTSRRRQNDTQTN